MATDSVLAPKGALFLNMNENYNEGRVYVLENNKEYIVKIESLGYEGEGVAKIDRYPIFIPGALKGETVKNRNN